MEFLFLHFFHFLLFSCEYILGNNRERLCSDSGRRSDHLGYGSHQPRRQFQPITGAVPGTGAWLLLVSRSNGSFTLSMTETRTGTRKNEIYNTMSKHSHWLGIGTETRTHCPYCSGSSTCTVSIPVSLSVNEPQ